MTNTKSYWWQAGFLSFSERMAMMLFGFGSLFLLLRMLSKADFGVWVLFVTTSAIIEVARTGLLQNALVRYLATAEKDTDYRQIMTASVALHLVFSGLSILLIGLLAAPLARLWQSENIQVLFYWYMATTLMLIPLHQANFIQQANLQFRGIFFGNFLNKGIFFGFVLWAFLTGFDLSLISLAICQVAAAGTGALASLAFARPYLRFSRELSRHWIGALFHYGKFVFGTNLSTMLYKSIDKMMLGYLSISSTVAVAVYELAIRITNLAEVPTFSMAAVVFPQSARRSAKEDKKDVARLYEKSVGAILAFIIPCALGVILLADWIVWIVGGDKYLDAAPILQWTMIYGLFVPFAVQFGTILDSTGRPKLNFYFTMGGAVVNIILNYVFISAFDMIGAVYGTLTTYVITFVMMQILLYRFFGVKSYRCLYFAFGFYKEIFTKIQHRLNPKLLTD